MDSLVVFLFNLFPQDVPFISSQAPVESLFTVDDWDSFSFDEDDVRDGRV